MPLDSEFCTFTFSQVDDDPGRVSVAQQGLRDPRYRRTQYKCLPQPQQHSHGAYIISLDDPFTGKLLGDIKSCTKSLHSLASVRIVLYDPHVTLTLSCLSCALRPSWSFTYEGLFFRIRRRTVLSSGAGDLVIEYTTPTQFTDDPAILIAQVHVATKKRGQTSMTMLDHNIARLRVQDSKGLEISILLALFFIFDVWRAKESDSIVFGSEAARIKQFKNEEGTKGTRKQRLEQSVTESRRDQASDKKVYTSTAPSHAIARLFGRRHGKETNSDNGNHAAPKTRAIMCH